MALSVLFAVNPPTDPAQNREWAVQANSAGYRLAWTLRAYAGVPLLVGLIAVFVALAGSAARRTALAGMLATVVAGGVALASMAYFVIVIPTAGVRIAAGDEAPILRFLDQIFREPGWILFGGQPDLLHRLDRHGPRHSTVGALPAFHGRAGDCARSHRHPYAERCRGDAAAVLQAAVAALLAVGLWRGAALTPS